MLACDNPFWRFSLAVYAAEGVAAECIALQDRHGVDVNVLLFCAWLGAARRVRLTEADLAAVEVAVRPWRDAAVAPLRAARRGIKELSDAADNDIAALRKEVAAAELRAEQIAQAMLYRVAAGFQPDGGASPEIVACHNIALLLRDTQGPERLIDAALSLVKSGPS